jgi:hypothetical protein
MAAEEAVTVVLAVFRVVAEAVFTAAAEAIVRRHL